jgi:hypothetical protein
MGAVGMNPPLVAARYGDYQDPFWQLPAPSAFPYAGSGITLFDSGPAGYTRDVDAADGGGNHTGTNPPPVADVPNRSGEDPHEAPRRAHCGQSQKDAFLSVGGLVTDPCGAPYFSWGWDGITGL